MDNRTLYLHRAQLPEPLFVDDYNPNWVGRLIRLSRDQARNELIIANVVKDLEDENAFILIPTTFIEHSVLLNNQLGIQVGRQHVGIIAANQSATERSEILNNVNSGDIRILIANQNILGGGFRLPVTTWYYKIFPSIDRPNCLLHETTNIRFFVDQIADELHPSYSATIKYYTDRRYKVVCEDVRLLQSVSPQVAESDRET